MTYSFHLSLKDIFYSLFTYLFKKPVTFLYVFISFLMAHFLFQQLFFFMIYFCACVALLLLLSAFKSKDLTGECSITIHEHTCTFTCPIYTSHVNWSYYEPIIISKHYIIIPVKYQNGIVLIPTRVFPSQSEKNQFIQTLEENYKKYNEQEGNELEA